MCHRFGVGEDDRSVTRGVILVAAWVMALTACGARYDQAAVDKANQLSRPPATSAQEAPQLQQGPEPVAAEPDAGTNEAAAPFIAAPDQRRNEANAGEVGAVPTAAPRRAGSAPPQPSTTGSAAAPAPTPATPAAGQPAGERTPGGAPAPGPAERPGRAGGPAPAVPKSEVVLGSVGVEAGILGAVTGPTPPAIRAWAAWVNARGGLAGHPVRVIIADDGNDPGRSQALVRQLVEEEKVIAFVNEFTLNTLSAVMPYLESKQIPVIGSIGGDLVGGASPMMFNPLTGSYGISHAWATLLTINAMTDKRKVGLVYCREVNGCASYVQTIKKLLPYGDLEIVYEAQVSLAQPDYTAEMLEAQRTGAEVVFILVDSASIVRVARSAHRQNYHPEFIAAFNASHDLVFTGGKDVEGLLVGGRYAPWDSSPLLQDYRDAMAAYQPKAPKGDLGGAVFIVGRLLEEKVAPFLAEPPTSAQFLEGLYALDKETLGGRLPGISFPHKSHEKVNLCTVPQRLVNGKFTTRDAAASFVCAPGWTPANRD
jgi:branched-chain amino acid transport system substrate-binding protein